MNEYEAEHNRAEKGEKQIETMKHNKTTDFVNMKKYKKIYKNKNTDGDFRQKKLKG